MTSETDASEVNAEAQNAEQSTPTTENTGHGPVSSFNVEDPNPNNVSAESGADWFLSDGVKGEGEKPDWFVDSKYKTVAEQAKAAIELRKALGGRDKAPEEYQVNMPEDYKDLQIATDDELYKDFTQFAKDARLSQEQFDSVLGMWAKYYKNNTDSFMKEFENSLGEQYKELGLDVQKAQQELTTWLTNTIGDSQKEVIDNALLDPYTAKILTLIKEKNNMGIPMPEVETVKKDMEYFKKKMSDSRYANNIQYSRAVDAEMADAVKRGML